MGKMPIGPTARMAVPQQEIGQGWIRTSEGVKPADLQSAPFGHSGTYPFASVDIGSRSACRKSALCRCSLHSALGDDAPGALLILVNIGLYAGADTPLCDESRFQQLSWG